MIEVKILHMKEKYYNEKQLRILSLYTTDYTAKFHLRRIARIIKTDTKTTSINLKKLEDLGIIISEKTGKHREFMLNFRNPLVHYFLIMAEVYRTVELLKKNFRIRKIFEMAEDKANIIILFGSYAKGLATKESDLDVLIIDGNLDPTTAEKIENLYGIKISPVHLSKEEFTRMQRNKEVFFKEILTTHIILKGFEFFVETTWRNYYGL